MHKFMFAFFLVFLSSYINAQEQESYWPKQIDLGDNYLMTIYSPEAENFENNILDARSAFSIYDNEHLPTFGAMWFRCRVLTDIKTNEVFFEDIRLMNANFPDATVETIEKLQQLIKDVVPNWHFNSNLKKFYEALQAINIKNEYSEDLRNNPPKIYYSKVPAVLVFIDGDPILADINNSDLYQYIVNTPQFIIKSSSDQQFYFNGGGNWYSSTDPTGTWKPIGAPPGNISRLASGANALPQGQSNTDRPTSGQSPKLIVTLEPAELIQTNGTPELNPVHENIFSIANSDDVILFDSYTDYYYILVSGRWYRTKNMEHGSWAFIAPEQLPEIFREIPPTSDFAHIRLSIPGTPEAISAALDNAIPQTAVVDREKATMEIKFDGAPEFAEIRGTSLKYGVNTNGSVIQDKDSTYYAVDQAVWFSAESLEGPWKAADHYPADVLNIPPSCPLFNVKFVYIYDSSPNIVYTGYTAGYLGSFLYHGVVYYGTGYRYKPWYGNRYIPRPSTYGYGAKKKSRTPNITVSVGVGYGYPGMGFGYPYGGFGYPYGGYGGYGMWTTHSSSATTYAGWAPLDNGATEQKPFDPVNIYINRSVGIIKTETARRNDPTKPVILKEQSPSDVENIYADKDGNVYKETADGSVYLRQNSDWTKTNISPANRK